MKTGRTIKVLCACLLPLLCLCACERDAFNITGDWEVVRAEDDSGQGYDPSRSTVYTFTGNQESGEITVDVSFFSGTYRVEGDTITMYTTYGRGPLWFNTISMGLITGPGSMQGRYTVTPASGGADGSEVFSGTWWAIKKQ